MQTVALKFCSCVFYESWVDNMDRKGEHPHIKPWRANWCCQDVVTGDILGKTEKHFETKSQAILYAWNWIHKGRQN